MGFTPTCCLPSANNKLICKEEEKEFEDKKESAIKNNDVVKFSSRLKNSEFGYSFDTPTNYYFIRDIKISGLKTPYYFFSLSDNKPICFIKITHVKPNDIPDNNYTILTDFFTNAYKNSNSSNIRTRLFKNSNRVYVYETEVGNDNLGKVKIEYIEDLAQKKLIILGFTCPTNEYNKSVQTFDKLVDNFKFEQN